MFAYLPTGLGTEWRVERNHFIHVDDGIRSRFYPSVFIPPGYRITISYFSGFHFFLERGLFGTPSWTNSTGSFCRLRERRRTNDVVITRVFSTKTPAKNDVSIISLYHISSVVQWTFQTNNTMVGTIIIWKLWVDICCRIWTIKMQMLTLVSASWHAVPITDHSALLRLLNVSSKGIIFKLKWELTFPSPLTISIPSCWAYDDQ